jgi:hypothetical protein
MPLPAFHLSDQGIRPSSSGWIQLPNANANGRRGEAPEVHSRARNRRALEKWEQPGISWKWQPARNIYLLVVHLLGQLPISRESDPINSVFMNKTDL